jgi:TonB family protein
MKTALCLLLAAGMVSGASIEGRVFDPSTAVIPQAQVILLRAGQQEAVTKTADNGAFRFESLVAGVYDIRVMTPGFAMFERRGLQLNENGDVQVHAILRMGEVQETIEVMGHGQAKPQKPAPARIRVGGNIQATRLLDASPPVYPAKARAEGREGIVILRAVISTDGSLLSVTALPGADAELADVAMDAIRQWRYSPTLLNGQPVEVATTVEVRFRLQ